MRRRTLLYFILSVIVGITNIFFFFFRSILQNVTLLFALPTPQTRPPLSYLIILPGATSKKKRQCIVNRLTGAEVEHVASAAHRSFYYHKCQRSSSSLARLFFFYYSGGNVKRICDSHNTATAPKARRRRAITQNATILFLFCFPPPSFFSTPPLFVAPQNR